MRQLNLFDPLPIDTANGLLDLLNHDRKKDLFVPVSSMEIGSNLLICAFNKEAGYVFNIVGMDGKTPDGMSANWRNASHIKSELFT